MKNKAVGIDLGGTETKIGLVDGDGDILKKEIISTDVEDGFRKVISKVGMTVLEMLKKENISKNEILGIGIGSPGSVDRNTGIVLFSPNFPDWQYTPLTEYLEEITNIDTFVENDANAFALGEWAFGKHRRCKNIIGLTLGTGVGGGVIINDQLLVGANGFASELGHVIVQPEGPLCGCGSHGCIESYASAPNIVRQAKEYFKKFPDSYIFSLSKITAKDVFDAAKKGDRVASLVLEKVTTILAIAISNYIHIFNPEYVIIGGGVSKAGSILLNPIVEKTPRYLWPSFKDTFNIELSNLIEDAGIKGSASIVYFRNK
jgi:glucokinase